MASTEVTELAARLDRALHDADLLVVVKTGKGCDYGVVSDSYPRQVEVMTAALLRAGLLVRDAPIIASGPANEFSVRLATFEHTYLADEAGDGSGHRRRATGGTD